MKRLSAGNKIILGVVMILLAAGCGLKSNPVPVMPATSQVPPQPQLAAVVDNDTVVLTWQNRTENDHYADIEKSELGTTGNICRDCPRTFTRVAQLLLKDNTRFIDKSVEKGKSYTYRLGLCDAAGNCRQTSPVEINLK